MIRVITKRLTLKKNPFAHKQMTMNIVAFLLSVFFLKAEGKKFQTTLTTFSIYL